MAKIDTSTIEGYADMSAEEKLAALESFEYEVPEPKSDTGEIERLKSAISKANSEAAELKRKLNAQLSEEERKAQEQNEELVSLRQTVADLQKKETISNYTAEFLKLKYDDAAASEAAKALADGNMGKVFSTMQKFLEQYAKDIKAEGLKNMPKPPAGQATKTVTKEDLAKMTPSERYTFSVEHPEEYKQIYSGG